MIASPITANSDTNDPVSGRRDALDETGFHFRAHDLYRWASSADQTSDQQNHEDDQEDNSSDFVCQPMRRDP